MEENIDKHMVTVVSSGIVKIALMICCTVFSCMWVSSCQINDSIIASCEDSCTSYGTYMESVTTRKCMCASPGDAKITGDYM